MHLSLWIYVVAGVLYVWAGIAVLSVSIPNSMLFITIGLTSFGKAYHQYKKGSRNG